MAFSPVGGRDHGVVDVSRGGNAMITERGGARMPRRLLIAAALVAVAPIAVPAALAHPGGAHGGGPALQAGAASADITPPSFAATSAPDPATCAPVDGPGSLDGAA